MTMTCLHGADLHGADFTDASMEGTDLTDADLSHAIGLSTVNFGRGITARDTNFQHADLRHARIPGNWFGKADFRNADLI